MSRFYQVFCLVLFVFVASCGKPQTNQAMVSTANPYASRAAVEILQAGGSAVDAAISAQLVLTLTEPQSSGIGGGAYLMYWDQQAKLVQAYDGRETAPAAAGPNLFLKPDGTPMPWREASIGGRPVGVPGVIAMLWLAHKTHGKLEWEKLFQPAITLAEEGFTVSPRLANAVRQAKDKLVMDDEAQKIYFRPTGNDHQLQPVNAGALLKNKFLAESLRLIAQHGPAAFYQGTLAQKIVNKVNGYRANPGALSAADMAGYQAKMRQPVCGHYRGYKICGMPPSSSGGLTSLMMLGILQPYRLQSLNPNGAMVAHLFTQASRLAFADRNLYIGDSDYVNVPDGLINPEYLRDRASLINPAKDMAKASAGVPPGLFEDEKRAADNGLVEYGTSHFSIVDNRGNAVSMTSSVERSFGSHLIVGGFVLNNQLTDFSFEPTRNGLPIANAPASLKRPRSSMSPTLVFNPDGTFFAALGSPGGSRIIDFTMRALTGLIDWHMPMQRAIDLPHVVNRNDITEIEQDTALQRITPQLFAMGHEINTRPLTSGLHGIRRFNGKLDGGADRRREGVVLTTNE